MQSEWLGELMDRKYIDENHIAARYLADQLSDSEREAFESYYVEHPEVMQELEVAARFKVGLMKMREAGELGQLMKRPAPFPRTLQFAAAAAVIVAAIGISIFYLRGSTRRRCSPPRRLRSLTAGVFRFQSERCTQC